MLNKPYRRAVLSAAIGCAAMLVPALQAIAQEFPLRVIKFVVSFPLGSGTATSERYFGKKLSELNGQRVIVKNGLAAAASSTYRMCWPRRPMATRFIST